MNQLASKKRKEHLDQVVAMIGELTPIGESKVPITNKDFRDVLLMMASICQFLFDEYGNDMEKSQRTVKVLDVDLENSFPNGVIENMSALRETVRSNLFKMKIPVELLAGSVINVTSKVITNCTVPVAIIAATKDKKFKLRK